jgi:site-specific recombinase XerD
MAELVRTKRPANTIAAYASDVRLFARAYRAGGGTRFPGGVRPVDVREYLATLRAAGTAPATLQCRCGGLVIFFRWAQASALVRSTPMVDIAVPAIDPPTRVTLRSSELRRLPRSVHQHGSVQPRGHRRKPVVKRVETRVRGEREKGRYESHGPW